MALPNHQAHSHRTETCQICKQAKPARQTLPAGFVRDGIAEVIRTHLPEWNPEGFICFPCLNHFRGEYVERLMMEERGELTVLEKEVVNSLRESDLIVANLNRQYERRLSFGDRIADRVAKFGGSWRFIFFFLGVMAVWIAVNAGLAVWRPFDPYPFILLNLFLSLIAAMQAPIIMMSQNRQAARDRLQAENDYKINLKAELEVRSIGEKLDQLVHHQWVRLMEIQQIQMEMIRDLSAKRGA